MSTIQLSETLANMKKTVQALVHAYNEWDYEATKATQAEDFTFEARPLSMGRESLNGEQFKDLFINFLAPSFKDFKIEAESIIHDPESLQSVLHGFFNILTPQDHPVRLEVVMLFKFNETGEKFVKVQEFFDSKVYLESTKAMQAAAKEGE
ncbi:hypothetical protein CB0940_04613 [Cercospora beticola]|uniref:SnoaL-like domain-containing protein n=1 Tax=Cercospora beticola TaxID=122368 RepID=A0A2G5HJP7_CERBT|nr:hypothetical protein CB0940_04613 [Cercospora beticola]PIA92781.1 hypothetical protein CB0940_04613 [Cercospora beticola]WPB01868.1 hypothetical protein RHO25_006500 [Cercospora beticola]CAK1363289.1 unnamed protein product [Cercospora beticola]